MNEKSELEELKQAVSAIQKKITMMEGNRTGQQDGNIGNAIQGEESYSNDFENVAKKKMLLKKMME